VDENRDNKIDRRWLVGNVFGWISIFGLMLAGASRNAGVFQSLEVPTIVIAPLVIIVIAAWSCVATLLFVGVPSRIAINLIVPERRRKRWLETLLCVVTFVVFCWVAFQLVTTPNPYP
jgi:hypothetical protein